MAAANVDFRHHSVRAATAAVGGNLREWAEDDDPRLPRGGAAVLVGGSWCSTGDAATSARYGRAGAGGRFAGRRHLGAFRIVRDAL